MGPMIIRLLDSYRRLALWLLQLRGKTPEDVAEERVISGQAWSEFCDTLKAAGATLHFPGTPKDGFNQAEGYRYLTRLARAGLENFMEYADPAAPVLRRMVHETVKMGADNPDNYYQNCTISSGHEYVIEGDRGTVAWLSFAVQAGHYGQEGGLRTTATLDASRLVVDDEGRFTLHISREPRSGNWLPLDEDASLLIVRQTFLDRSRERIARLAIRCVGEGVEPAAVSAQSVDEGLRNAGTLVAGASLLFAKWARDFSAHSNELPRFDQQVSDRAGGDPNIAYYHSHWALGPDEVLVIEAMPPECEHWNFQLNNYWMESLDYRYYPVHTNKHLASYEKDGSVVIVVAHQDPGHPNWIHTVGHQNGTMCFRWVGAGENPQPRTRVMAMTDFRRERGRLPAGEEIHGQT